MALHGETLRGRRPLQSELVPCALRTRSQEGRPVHDQDGRQRALGMIGQRPQRLPRLNVPHARGAVRAACRWCSTTFVVHIETTHA